MRYIDRTDCKSIFEKVAPEKDMDINSAGDLTREATAAAERNGLGVLKTSWGGYKIITASGLGAYTDELGSLAEVNAFLLNLKKHNKTKIGGTTR